MDNSNKINHAEPLTSLNVSTTAGKPANPTRKDTKLNYKQQLTGQEVTEVTPHFLVMKKKEGDFSKVSPFLIDRIVSECAGVTKSVKKIETANATQSKKLLSLKRFADDEVEVIPHNTLNYCKGVVVCSDLLNCDVEEIKNNLNRESVVEVKRITARKDGNIVNTASLIVTFNKVTLPNKIKAGIHVLPVRPYILAPLRCFRQRTNLYLWKFPISMF